MRCGALRAVGYCRLKVAARLLACKRCNVLVAGDISKRLEILVVRVLSQSRRRGLDTRPPFLYHECLSEVERCRPRENG